MTDADDAGLVERPLNRDEQITIKSSSLEKVVQILADGDFVRLVTSPSDTGVTPVASIDPCIGSVWLRHLHAENTAQRREIEELRRERDKLKDAFEDMTKTAGDIARKKDVVLSEARDVINIGLDTVSEAKGWGTYKRMEGTSLYDDAEEFRRAASAFAAKHGGRDG